MTGKEQTEELRRAEIEAQADTRKYPVGTKLVQTNGGPTGEIMAIKGNYGDVRVVRTAGVDREALVGQIDAYVELGKITIA